MGVTVVDSSVLIDSLRGHAASRDALRAAGAGGDHLVASVVTRTELLVGMRAAEKRATRTLIDALDWVPVDAPIADAAGAFGRRFRASHRGLGHLDLLIAATAAVLEADLWTTNVKHFPMFPDLEPPY